MLLLLEYVLRGVMLGAMYGLLALPMSLMFVTVGTVDFALGAYALLAAAVAAGIGGAAGVAAGLATAVGCSALMACIFVLLKKTGHRDTITIALASFGLAVAIGSVVLGLWGGTAFVKEGFTDVWSLGTIRVTPQGLLNLVAGGTVLAAFCWVLYGTGTGRALRASAINAEGAELAGIRVLQVQSSMFLVGGLVAGVTGLLILYGAGLDFTAGLNLTLSGFAAAIVFGISNPVRGFLGGVAIGVVEALSSGYASGAVTALVPQVIIIIALTAGLFKAARFSGDRP